MLTRLQTLLAGRRKKLVSGGCRLAVETLESRTVLSATHLVAQALLAAPLPAEARPDPVHAAPMAGSVQAGIPLLQGKAGLVSQIIDLQPIERPIAGFVNAVHFATESPSLRFLDPGDAARPTSVDPAIAAWDSSSRSRPDWAGPFDVVAGSLPGDRTSVLPPPGRGLALAADRAWVVRIWETGLAPVEDSRARGDTQAPPPLFSLLKGLAREEPAARLLEGRAVPAFDAIRPLPPAFGPLATPFDDSLPAPLMTSQDSSSFTDGGLVALAAHEASDTTDWDIYQEPLLGRLSTTANSTVPSIAIGQKNVQAVRSGSLPSEIYDSEPATKLIDLLGHIRPSALDSENEGGVVEIGDFDSPIGSSLSPQQATRRATTTADAIGDHEKLDSRKRLRSRAALHDELLDENRLQDILEPQTLEDRAEQDPAGRRLGDVANDSRWAREHEEGGMIELVAAACSTAGWSQVDVSPAGDRATGIDTIHGVGTGSIPMDTGVGLFQAFELAAGPAEPIAQPQAGPQDRNEPGAAPAPSASAATEVDARAEQAALSGEGMELLVNRALAVPSVLVVVSLLNRAARRRAQEDSLHADPYAEAAIRSKNRKPRDRAS